MITCKTLRHGWAVALAIVWSVFSIEVEAAKVTLQWDRSPDPTVVGYRVYVQQVGAVNMSVIETGNTTLATIENLIEGKTYSIYTTAYDATRFESDPSNAVIFSVPAIPTGFALQFDGFAHATAEYSPRGAMSARGEVFPEGTRVTLSARAEAGYECMGWMINGVVVAGNPGVATMNQDTLVAPLLKKQSGGTNVEPPPNWISLKIGAVSGKAVISVGGELGAWVLEGSTGFPGAWSQVAQGLTSEQVTITPSVPYAFYRVRPATLAVF